MQVQNRERLSHRVGFVPEMCIRDSYDVLFRHVAFYNDVDVGPHERTVFFKNTYFPAELVCQSSLYVL